MTVLASPAMVHLWPTLAIGMMAVGNASATLAKSCALHPTVLPSNVQMLNQWNTTAVQSVMTTRTKVRFAPSLSSYLGASGLIVDLFTLFIAFRAFRAISIS